MAHARQQIREAVASALSALSTTGSNVFQSRVHPLQDNALPALRIYSTEEETLERNGDKVYRMLTVRVEGCVKAAANSDDTADTISAEVEAAIFADYTLGGLCKIGELTNVSIDLSGDAEQPIAVVTMNFDFMYRVDSTDPETIIS